MALTAGLLLAALALHAQPAPAEASYDAPLIDVYTMGQGEDIFAHFGHSAICVTDHQSPKGRCYNYGTADFSTPVPLTFDFIRGRALFWVSVVDRARMLSWYVRDDRTLWRQRLPLSPEQAKAVAAELAASTAESEKYYRYHHFDDNCTTRIRDLIDRVLGGVLSRDTRTAPTDTTFREHARQGFAGYPPLLVAATLVLGRARDRPATRWEAMFLPEVFRDELELLLGAKPVVEYLRRAPVAERATWSGDALLAGIGAALGLIALAGALRPRLRRATLAPAGLVLGLAGGALWFLAIASSFSELRWNEALLVLMPTDLALPFLSSRLLSRYLVARLGLLALAAAASVIGLFVQPLWPALLLAGVPLWAALFALRRSDREKIFAPPSVV